VTKYGNKKVTIDGITFHSKGEGDRYLGLKLLQKQGIIEHLELQPAYKIVINGHHICTYKADFRYSDKERGCFVVEDFKSVATAKNSTYRLKKKLVEAQYYPVKIVEVIK